jgi:uncharacterized membrane protein
VKISDLDNPTAAMPHCAASTVVTSVLRGKNMVAFYVFLFCRVNVLLFVDGWCVVRVCVVFWLLLFVLCVLCLTFKKHSLENIGH